MIVVAAWWLFLSIVMNGYLLNDDGAKTYFWYNVKIFYSINRLQTFIYILFFYNLTVVFNWECVSAC